MSFKKYILIIIFILSFINIFIFSFLLFDNHYNKQINKTICKKIAKYKNRNLYDIDINSNLSVKDLYTKKLKKIILKLLITNILILILVFIIYKYNIGKRHLNAFTDFINEKIKLVNRFIPGTNYNYLLRLYLFLSLFFGILYCLFYPPLHIVDESIHFYRIYQFTDFKLFAKNLKIKYDSDTIRFKAGEYIVKGAKIPTSIVNTVEVCIVQGKIFKNNDRAYDLSILHKLFFKKLDKNIKRNVETAFTYSPINYIPQILGVFIGKTFNFSPILILYLGRFFGLFFSIFLGYYSLKLLPSDKFKIFFFLIYLMPKYITSSFILGTDCVTNSISLFFASYVFYLTFNEQVKNIKINNIIILIFLSVILSFLKNIYVIVVLLILIIPVNKYFKIKNYILSCSITIILSFSLCFLWNISYGYDINNSDYDTVEPSKQIKYAITNPHKYIKVIFNTTLKKGKDYIKMFVNKVNIYIKYYSGKSYLLNNFFIFKNFEILYFMLIFICLLIKNPNNYNENIKINIFQRSVLISLFIMIYILVHSILYASFTRYQGDIVRGVDGRYFIPVAFTFFAFSFNLIQYKKIFTFIILMVFVINFINILNIFNFLFFL